jgi:uncharacterized phage protein gp47/JayE
MIPIDYVRGLERAELTEILIPGEDEEETEVFRQRYFDSFNGQSFGGNRQEYLEEVRKIDGVGNLKVTRIWNDGIRPSDMIPGEKVADWYKSVINTLNDEVALWLSNVYLAACEKKLTVGGTVLITVVNSMDFGAASDVLVDKIQTELDPEENAGEGYGLAPIGHVVQVKSAEPIEVFIKTTVSFETGYSWSNTKAAFQSAIEEYLLELRQEWANSNYLTVRVSRIETKILSAKGVLDVANTSINGDTDNLVLTEYQIPVLGGISDNEGS